MLRRTPMRALLILLALTTCLSAAPAAAAQDLPVNWQPLGGPGGRVSLLTADAAGQTLYAVSVGGVQRQDDQTQWREAGSVRRADAVYRSLDEGATWQPATNDLPPGPISALYLDEQHDAVYAAVQGGGDSFTRRYELWYTAGAKDRWMPAALGRDDLIIRRVLRNAGGKDLLLGVSEAAKYPNSFIYRQGADGAWNAYPALRFEQRPGSTLSDLAAHPTLPERLFITTFGGDLFISQDTGQTWALAQVGADGIHSVPPKLAFSPDQPNTALLVRNTNGADGIRLLVERTTDGGLRWSRVVTTGLPTDSSPRALAALPGGVFLLNTTAGTFRSSNGGGAWQPLEGALSSGDVSAFLTLAGEPAAPDRALAATGYGVFVSRDAGAIWQPMRQGLPFNSKIAGLLTHPGRPDQIFAISDNRAPYGVATPPAVLRSLDGGERWLPAAQGLPAVPITAWAIDPNDPDTLALASWEHVFLSHDAGVSWQRTRLPLDRRVAIAFAPSDRDTIYLAGRPIRRSTDRGATWQEIPILTADPARQTEDVNGLAVDPADAGHLWAALPSGVYESRDGGRAWQALGPAGRAANWVAVVPDGAGAQTFKLYAGFATGDAIARWDGQAWTPAATGLPPQSNIIAFAAGAGSAELWAARDGGGIYRSADAGAGWTNAGAGMGDNLVQALAPSYSEPGAMLAGIATAGVWKLTGAVRPAAAPTAAAQGAGVDARIEIVWPHNWAPVSEAKLANIGLRLFLPGSLLQPACGWRPRVNIWQAVDSAPATPLALAEQRSVDGQPFPYWVLNDVDVSRANDPTRKLYFLTRVEGVDTATSVWAHGADPRTYLPQPDVPSGIATGALDAVDARIQIVWPHDETGRQRPVAEAPLINVSVTLFKHGARLSVPMDWRPGSVTLYGAWNQEVGKPLSRQAEVATRQAGAITYPTWEFNNIPVARAADPRNKLYLWVSVDGAETYPTIWAHGADSRTFFPAQDEPIQGCAP